jgi:phytoene dehydrogenase-like protein
VVDAVVIGAGPNGLVAANLLQDAGWEVVVLEDQPEPGGAVKSAELTEPGFTHDLFSAFYPLAHASPVMQSLDLESHGLRWLRSSVALAHPAGGGACAALCQDPGDTAASLDSFAPGDGDAWLELYDLWRQIGGDLRHALFSPFPPVRAGTRLAVGLGVKDLLRFMRFCLLPVRRLCDERFSGQGAGLLLAGNALHADLSPELPLSAFYGWLLTCAGQDYGYPVPEGGAGELTAALVRRFLARGGSLECSTQATQISVSAGRAGAVKTADGRTFSPARAVIGAIGARALYLDLVGAKHLPDSLVTDLRFFHYDTATVKVDWALDKPIPWLDDAARQASTVHVGASMDELTSYCAQVAMNTLPDSPYLVVGQYSGLDSSRSANGHTAWAYTHVPQTITHDSLGELRGVWDEREAQAFAHRVENRIEQLAPGFLQTIRARHVLTPARMYALNRNLVGGALGGGTAQLHQQLVMRPVPGNGRCETPISGLYLGSASAHPGGGVHGAPGANAARAALSHDRLRRARSSMVTPLRKLAKRPAHRD